MLLLVGKTSLLSVVDSQKSPDVLRARAREVLASLGWPERPIDWAAEILRNEAFWPGFRRTISPPTAGGGESRATRSTYWYRQSPTRLVPGCSSENGFPVPA